MGMTPREIEEKELARRRKILKRYYWNGMELRPKCSIEEEPASGSVSKLWNLIRRLPRIMRSQR